MLKKIGDIISSLGDNGHLKYFQYIAIIGIILFMLNLVFDVKF